jgi:hypothetical protein
MQLNYLKKRFNLLLIKDVIEAYVSNWLGLLFFCITYENKQTEISAHGILNTK